jgi:release factor glutamine methyltransferase
MAYILGKAGFWTLTLAVSPATLIPRPESETLIEAALAVRPERGAVRRVLDLGTGTGALLLAALSEFPDAWGVGVDRVEAACALAAGNAAANVLWGLGGGGCGTV